MKPLRKNNLSSETFFKTIWISTCLAMIFSLPPLGVFLAIYFNTGNLIFGVMLGFSIHFITLAFSSNISNFLLRVTS